MSPTAPELARALDVGAIVGLPVVGRYCVAWRAGAAADEHRIDALGRAPEGGGTGADEPYYLVGDAEAVRGLTVGWSDELSALLMRCWPGPVEVAVRGEHSVLTIGQPDGRALRKLCRELGPWRAVPLGCRDPRQVVDAVPTVEVACVADGGVRIGPPSTLVDASVTPLRVAREGALPTSFIEGAMLMSTRRRWFERLRRPRG